MYKIIFFDLDGTLFSHETRSIPKSTIEALKECKNNGIKIVLITGRNKEMAAATGVFDVIDFDYFIFCNGTIVLDKDKNIIYSRPIDKDLLDLAFEDAKLCKSNMLLAKYDTLILLNDNYDLANEALKSFYIELPPVTHYQNEVIHQIHLFVRSEDRHFFDNLNDRLHIHPFNDVGYDVYMKDATKFYAIEELIKYLNLDISEVIAFGDGNNDAKMIKHVGLGISMGNGSDWAKEHAKYVTTGVDEDGIYNALKHFKII